MIRAKRKRTSARIEMRILLLGPTGAEPAFAAWDDCLTRAGVPFDAVACDGRPAPVAVVDETGNARYQGLILVSGGLADVVLEAAQRTELERLERELGLRRLTAYAYPGPQYGLAAPAWAGPLESVGATLTARGREIFPQLRHELPIDPGSWSYLAAPAEGAHFETLVAGPDRSALLGIHYRPDGREEMVQLFDANAAQTQGRLLRRGQLAWLTRGTFVGLERNYLSVQIDDVLLANHSWDIDRHESDPSARASLRMTAQDARRAATWSRARGLRLDLACNGGGSRRYMDEAGIESDPLLAALLLERDAFGWINHTFQHLNLNEVPQAVIETEIERNFRWAQGAGIEFEPETFVSGEHTGLANLVAVPPVAENSHLATALRAQRIRYLACDASRPYPARRGRDRLAPGAPFVIGTALVIPRHPTALAHDAATEEQALDRVRHAGRVRDSSWPEVVESEADRIFAAMINNDPRPHYFHQSNLIGTGDEQRAPGIFGGLLDAVLNRYERYVAPQVPIMQPTLAEIGRLLLALEAWSAVLTTDSISAYIEGPQVRIVNRASVALEMPLTGVAVDEERPGSGPGWICVMPGETLLERRPLPVGG